jgi:hypothetical protein
MNQRTEVYLTDEQVELARMAREDFYLHPDQDHKATGLLRETFGLSLTQAVCAVAYARKHPV